MVYILSTGYGYLQYMFDYVIGTWPLVWLYKAKIRPPSDDAVTKVDRIIQHLYQNQQADDEISTQQICEEIQTLDYKEDVFDIRDLYGLNLLQHAILVNNLAIVQLLISERSCSPEIGCNSPMHLAASSGHSDILRCLAVKKPFHLYKKAGICYPRTHRPVMYHEAIGFRFQEVYKCQKEKLLPIEWAIKSDQAECAEEIVKVMKSMGGRRYNLPAFLHFSASKGSAKCLQYFVDLSPNLIDHVSKTGDVPLLEAVVWGRKCAKVLIDNGADVNRVAENGDTALHRLYRNDIDGIFAIYDTTKYLLTTGIEQLVNAINLRGETALHLLVTHVSYIGGNYFHPEERSKPRGEMQLDYQEQVIQTIKLLLSFNADPHIYDSLNLQPLNKLLHVTMKASRPEDKFDCVQGCINSKYIYRNDFSSLAKAIEVLIDNGAEVNTSCSIGHTPLILLVQTLLFTEVPALVQQADNILSAIHLLLKNGAKCNFISEDQKTCCSLLADLAKKILRDGSRRLVDRDTQLIHKYAKLINDILIIFLQHGLNPNYTTTKKSPHLLGGSGNALIEFIHLTMYASNGEDFRIIHTWLRTLFQWGADPDIESYPSDPIICHSQSSIFLKKQSTQAVSHYIHEVKELQAIFEHGQAEELLMLFYKTMDHKVLYDCLTTATFMARFHPQGATGNTFLAILNNMTERPRSLKQMARVAIYKAVQRKLTTSIDKLPLPNSIKQYLLNIE